MLEKAGEIKDLRLQVPFELIPAQVTPSGKKERPAIYICDFQYMTCKGKLIVEDVKGASPDIWVIKRKLMLSIHGIEVQEIRA
jgi:hypothetical protein